MYAIVEMAGQQFKVSPGTKVYVNRLDAKEGTTVEFDNVLLVDNDGKIEVGAPRVEGVKVTATVLSHLKGDKVIVFKKKRRKGYQKSNGHRQYLTQVLIDAVGGAGKAPKKAAAKKAAKEETDSE
jgi:large subunit ribosomal protein L21